MCGGILDDFVVIWLGLVRFDSVDCYLLPGLWLCGVVWIGLLSVFVLGGLVWYIICWGGWLLLYLGVWVILVLWFGVIGGMVGMVGFASFLGCLFVDFVFGVF